VVPSLRPSPRNLARQLHDARRQRPARADAPNLFEFRDRARAGWVAAASWPRPARSLQSAGAGAASPSPAELSKTRSGVTLSDHHHA
jgi:hypothetical protein